MYPLLQLLSTIHNRGSEVRDIHVDGKLKCVMTIVVVES